MSVTSKSRPLAFLPFQHPSPTKTAPSGDGWIHEIKQDGYRTELVIENGIARAFSRSGHDWTKKYPALVMAAASLKAKSAVLDGEAVIQDERGLSDFHALRAALSAEPHRVIFFAFDLLHLDGEDLRRVPLNMAGCLHGVALICHFHYPFRSGHDKYGRPYFSERWLKYLDAYEERRKKEKAEREARFQEVLSHKFSVDEVEQAWQQLCTGQIPAAAKECLAGSQRQKIGARDRIVNDHFAQGRCILGYCFS